MEMLIKSAPQSHLRAFFTTDDHWSNNDQVLR